MCRYCDFDDPSVGLYDVLVVRPPKGWKPIDWDDVPPAPFRVLGLYQASADHSTATGIQFGFNTWRIDDPHREHWVILCAVGEMSYRQKVGLLEYCI